MTLPVIWVSANAHCRRTPREGTGLDCTSVASNGISNCTAKVSNNAYHTGTFSVSELLAHFDLAATTPGCLLSYHNPIKGVGFRAARSKSTGSRCSGQSPFG